MTETTTPVTFVPEVRMPTHAALGILTHEEIREFFEEWFSRNGGSPNTTLTEESTLGALGITDEVITKMEKHGHLFRRRFDPKQPDEALVKGYKNLLDKDWTYGHFLNLLDDDHLCNI